MAWLAYEVDDLLGSVGVGRWQLIQYGLLMFFFLCWVHSYLGIIILGFVPDYTCLPPKSEVNTHIPRNISFGRGCLWYNVTANTSEACSGGFMYAEPKEASIVSEWDLVCGRTYLPDLSQTILQVGYSVGIIIFSPLADKFGRRPLVIWCHLSFLFVQLGACLATDVTMFIIFRFFIGAFLAGTGTMFWVLMLELFTPKHRTLAALISNIFWGICACTLPALGYIMKGLSWRYVQLAMSSFSISVVFCYFFVYESVRWLMANGQEKDAIHVIWKAGEQNGASSEKIASVISSHFSREERTNDGNLLTELETKIDNKFEDNNQDTPKAGDTSSTNVPIKALLTHTTLRRISLVMLLTWFTNSLTYTGLLMLSSTMSGDRYMNLFLSTVVEIPAGVIMLPIVLKCGRKKILILLHLLGAVSLVSAAVINAKAEGSLAHIFKTAVVMVGKFSISSTFNLIFMYSPEVYPTNIRSIGMGSANMASRVGGFLSPFAVTVGRSIPWLPAAVFGGLCLLVACACSILPETLNKDLPQTLDDLDGLYDSGSSAKMWETAKEKEENLKLAE